MKFSRIKITMAALCLLTLTLATGPAHAQMLGANTLGDYGLQSATQPPPGFTLVAMYYHYDGNELVDSQGNEIAIDPQHEGALDANAYVLGGWYVTRAKLFGGNYGFMVYPAFSNTTVQAPILDLTSTTGTGFSDLYIQPINLGWHTDRADILAGLAVTAPTGRFSAGADDNIGMGMWSYEVSGGATLYFDQAKTFSFATMAYFEFHSEKKDTDQKVGNILTLEGGLGKAFYGGGLTVGAAYYAQWKLSQDQLGAELEAELAGFVPGKSRGYGIGPEVVAGLISGTKYLGSISLRYLWDTGVRTSIKGGTFCLTATFPIPSMSLE